MLHDVLNDPLHLEQGRHGGAEPIPSELFHVRKGGGGSNKRHLSEVGHVGDALNLLRRQRSDQGNRIEFLNQARDFTAKWNRWKHAVLDNEAHGVGIQRSGFAFQGQPDTV